MAMEDKPTSTLIFGILGAALFKFVTSYVAIHREIATVKKEIDEKMQEIRDEWR